MKKILFSTLCFTFFGFAILQAQKTKSDTPQSEAGHGSAARNAKGVGKGSPLLQRNAGGTTDDATESPSGKSTPAPAPAPASPSKVSSPAPTSDKPKTETPAAVSTKSTISTSPKESPDGLKE